MFNLITTAYATEAAETTGGSNSGFIMIILLVAIFYFLMIRPENKRKKEAQAMRDSISKGQYVTTIGGVYGKVVAVTDQTVVIETSDDRVRVEFVKSAIGTIGSLEEQAAAAAQPRPSLFSRKKKTEEPETVQAEPKVEKTENK